MSTEHMTCAMTFASFDVELGGGLICEGFKRDIPNRKLPWPLQHCPAVMGSYVTECTQVHVHQYNEMQHTDC
jgi:hypothetical protein